jgi:hypothetical protein
METAKQVWVSDSGSLKSREKKALEIIALGLWSDHPLSLKYFYILMAALFKLLE